MSLFDFRELRKTLVGAWAHPAAGRRPPFIDCIVSVVGQENAAESNGHPRIVVLPLFMVDDGVIVTMDDMQWPNYSGRANGGRALILHRSEFGSIEAGSTVICRIRRSERHAVLYDVHAGRVDESMTPRAALALYILGTMDTSTRGRCRDSLMSNMTEDEIDTVMIEEASRDRAGLLGHDPPPRSGGTGRVQASPSVEIVQAVIAVNGAPLQASVLYTRQIGREDWTRTQRLPWDQDRSVYAPFPNAVSGAYMCTVRRADGVLDTVGEARYLCSFGAASTPYAVVTTEFLVRLIAPSVSVAKRNVIEQRVLAEAARAEQEDGVAFTSGQISKAISQLKGEPKEDKGRRVNHGVNDHIHEVLLRRSVSRFQYIEGFLGGAIDVRVYQVPPGLLIAVNKPMGDGGFDGLRSLWACTRVRGLATEGQARRIGTLYALPSDQLRFIETFVEDNPDKIRDIIDPMYAGTFGEWAHTNADDELLDLTVREAIGFFTHITHRVGMDFERTLDAWAQKTEAERYAIHTQRAEGRVQAANAALKNRTSSPSEEDEDDEEDDDSEDDTDEEESVGDDSEDDSGDESVSDEYAVASDGKRKPGEIVFTRSRRKTAPPKRFADE